MGTFDEVLAEEWTLGEDVIYCGRVETDQKAFSVYDGVRYRAMLVSDAETDEDARTRAAVAVLGHQTLAWLMRMEGGFSSMSEESFKLWARDGDAIILAAQQLRRQEST